MFKKYKEIIITVLFSLACLIGYVFFPAKGIFQYKVITLIFLIILPFLFNNLFLEEKKGWREIFQIGNWKEGLKWLGYSAVISFLIIVLLLLNTDLADHYFLPMSVKNNFGQFLLYEMSGVLFTVFIYTYFFLAFLMNFFVKYIGKWSIVIQYLFFLIMIIMFNLPYWFYISYIVFLPLAGLVFLKSKSIIYPFLGQWLFVVFLDAYFIASNFR